jgi:type IV pilus assembly protein PilC
MPLFTYTAVRKDGTRYKGTRDARDRLALFSQLRKEGESVVSVAEAGGGFVLSKAVGAFQSISQAEKITFIRNLSAMLVAGLSLSRALTILERQARNQRLKSTIGALNDEIRKGSPLHVALSKFPKVFSPLLISMVRAGEETGGLSQALSVVATQMERMYALGKRVKGALIYPSIVVTVMIGIGILMLIYVVPTLSSTFKELGVDLPPSTAAIIGISDFLVGHTLAAAFGLLALIGAAIALGKTKPGKRAIDWALIRLPVIGTIVVETNAARTARTLSSLFSAGVSALQAIAITRDVIQNSFHKDVLTEAGGLVEKGFPLSDAFLRHEKVYPILFAEMLAVGEETGQNAQMLLKVAEFYEGEVEQKTKDISTVIEPLLMVVIGGGVGFFALAMITPIYSISGGI